MAQPATIECVASPILTADWEDPSITPLENHCRKLWEKASNGTFNPELAKRFRARFTSFEAFLAAVRDWERLHASPKAMALVVARDYIAVHTGIVNYSAGTARYRNFRAVEAADEILRSRSKRGG